MHRIPILVAALTFLIAACAPAAPPSPTAAPPKPAPTTAPAKPAESKPAPTTAPAAKPAEAKPAASPAAKAEAKPAASPAAKAEAKPAASPAAKPAAKFDEQAIADFYRGKTVRVIVGFAPGGGFDVVARIVANALPAHIPGNPNLVVVNQPSAGSLVAANQVSNSEPQDGTVIGVTSERTIVTQAVGDPAVQFDARRVNWLASFSSSPITCAVRRDLGFKDIRDLINGPVVPMAATGGSSLQAPLLLNRVLGTNFKPVTGYPGIPQSKLAIETKEVDGVCISWDGLNTTMAEWFKEPLFATPLSMMGPPTPPDEPLLRSVPRVEDLVKTDFDRKLVDGYAKADSAAIPFHVGPNVPADRVAALRAAVARVGADREVLERIQRAGRKPVVRSGEEVARTYNEVLQTPPDVIEELKKILTGQG